MSDKHWKHWSSPIVVGWEKSDTRWPLHPNHHRTPYTDGPDWPRPMSIGDLQRGFEILKANGRRVPPPLELFLNESGKRWLRAFCGYGPVVHDPAPPPTLDEPAVTG